MARRSSIAVPPLLCLFLTVSLLSAVGAAPPLNLVVRLLVAESAVALLDLRLHPGDEFSVLYRHSVEQTWVEEIFGWSPGGLVLRGVRFSSFGAGLPYTVDRGTFSIDEDGFLADNLDIPVDSFSIMPVPDNEYTLRWNQVELRFSQLVSGARVWIGPDNGY